MKKIITISICIMGLSFGNVSAQDTLHIDLDLAMSIALDKSYSMLNLKENLKSVEYSLNAAKASFKSNASLNLQAPRLDERVSEISVADGNNVFNSISEKAVQSVFAINQPLPTDGKITLNSSIYQRERSTIPAFNPDTTFLDNKFYTSLQIGFNQPLFTYNRIKTGLKKAELDYQRTVKRFKRSELDIVYNVTQAFYNLYRYSQQVEIAGDDVARQQDVYDIAQKKYNAGVIAEVDALQTEVDLASAKNSLTQATGDLNRAERAFKQLIGIDLDTPINIIAQIEYKPVNVSLEKAMKEGRKHSPTVKEREIDVELNRISVMETQAWSEVSANISGYYDITGVSSSDLSGSSSTSDLFNSAYDDLQDRPKNKGISFNVSIPVWDWGRNSAQVQSAMARLKRSELAEKDNFVTVRREIEDVVSRVAESAERLEILAQTEELAQKTFDISQQRFRNGEISNQDLKFDQDRLTNARMSYLGAFISYKLSLADLQRTTFWDFENGISLVD